MLTLSCLLGEWLMVHLDVRGDDRNSDLKLLSIAEDPRAGLSSSSPRMVQSTGDGQQVRLITLENGEHLDAIVRRMHKGWVVRFHRGSSLLGRRVLVKTSLTGDKPLTWSSDKEDLDVYCDVPCTTAGSFKYQFFVDSSTTPSGSGYFLVMPELHANGTPLRLDGIACLTHLTKLLGEFPQWETRLQITKECGYNMLHLTPIHELGISNSSYSISDHHDLIQTIHSKDHKYTFDDVAAFVQKMEKEWGVLTVQDVVWNHAAKNAKWLLEHPESAYNCFNSPHLRPAFVIDRIYHHFGREVSEGKWADRGVPADLSNDHHVKSLEYLLRTEVLPKARLHEFFQVDVDACVKRFEELAKVGPSDAVLDERLEIVQDAMWRRFGSSVDFGRALAIFNRHRGNGLSEEERLSNSVQALRAHLEQLNVEAGARAWDYVMAGLNAMIGHITYERVAGHGPRHAKVTEKTPLTTDYFLMLHPKSSWEEEENQAYDEKQGQLLMAFNGWVMSDNPLKNFALSDSQTYLCRELVCWGDSVKLNYGEKPDDCPYLWNYMKEYTQQCAKMFHGLRIDNAHGTPIHLAEYLLLAAREVRPDIYVFAELFTGSERLDNLFVNKLGITSLIREAQAAGDSHEQGRLVYRYGGDSVGAMMQHAVRPSKPTIAHGLFLDQSHDNPTPIETRSVYDLLPTAAMLSMASCAIGSTRGYDEFVRHAINVVNEKRPYANWPHEVSHDHGIIAARRVLNELHISLAQNGFTEVFVDQMNPDVVGITRHNPKTRETVVVVSHTAFNKNGINGGRVFLKQFPVGGVLEEILFEMSLTEASPDPNPEQDDHLNGLQNYEVSVREHLQPADAKMCTVHNSSMIELTEFPSGSVVGFKIRLTEKAQNAVNAINKLLAGDSAIDAGLDGALEAVPTCEFNELLYRCEGEEQSVSGSGAYDMPQFGKLVYCGLQGLIPVLDHIRDNNDLGHPLCSNLRNGLWLVDYMLGRLKDSKHLSEVAKQMKVVMEPLQEIPYYLRPCYFEALVGYIYDHVEAALWKKLSSTSSKATGAFIRSLAVASVAFVGKVPGAKLSPLADELMPADQQAASLAAGLPHFATGIWRNWGRDTFVALPGCLLATGRYEEARNIILSFAGSMRHGLIPNLLAEGIGARFNCRDAVWFWLYAIVKFVDESPDGKKILTLPVKRLYPTDDSEASEKDTVFGSAATIQPLFDVMYEALSRHFAGISYRERNAGSRIDEHMKDEGFNIQVFVDRNTGFVHGGNRWNCGTWMDKMGSSEKAGNRGEPATPRDGAAVELQGLAYAVLSALERWHKAGVISKDSVKGGGVNWTWNEWAQKIADNFEKHFFVADDCQDQFVNRRGIVKDSVGSSQGFTDYQLRCNFPIALAVAPTLLKPENAWRALNEAKVLLGPVGMKTLDPTDWAYNGFYNNDDDGTNKATAKGWNYHQGPEWLWVAGYYLRARLAIASRLGGHHVAEAKAEVQSRIGNYHPHLQESPWRSLTELTNENGSFCNASCPAQAWSVGCVLEACLDLEKL